MLGFYNRLQKTKKEYLAQIAVEAKKYNNIVIYGAGRVAKPIVHKLQEEQIKISSFVVSDVKINEKEFFGISVRQIEEINFSPEDTLVIIAVKYVWAQDVLNKILKNGYVHYVFPPKEIDYFAREESDEVHRPVMEFTLKAGCSINCKFCPQKLFLKSYFEKNNREEYLSFENFKICLSKLPSNTIISFCGFVEPFLHPQAVDMIEYTWRQGYEMKLYTTLVGLSKDGYNRIKNIPFHYVVLHTPDEQEYANIPMTKEYFEILDMALEQKKADGSHFIDTANCQGIPHQKIIEHTMGKLRIMSELYDRAGNLEKDDALKSVEKIEGNIYCIRVNEQLNNNVLLPDGTVVLCNFDFGMQHVLGNLLQDSYEDIMNGERMKQIIKALDDGSVCGLLCRKCNFAISV